MNADSAKQLDQLIVKITRVRFNSCIYVINKFYENKDIGRAHGNTKCIESTRKNMDLNHDIDGVDDKRYVISANALHAHRQCVQTRR